MKHDVIGITVRKEHLTKFVAISLGVGYIALLLTGILLITLTNQWFAYDVVVHTFFIGFVFSMIFAHGPIILPGVLGLSAKPFHKILYLWLALMEASWLIRIFADAFTVLNLRKISGVLSALAIVAYFVTMAVLTFKRQHAKLR
jgi:hypothetical protein